VPVTVRFLSRGTEKQAGLDVNNKKHFTEAKKFTKKQQGPKRGRQRIGGQGRVKQAGQEYPGHRTTEPKTTTIDGNPTGGKGKTDTIYRGGTQVYDIRH